MNEALKYLMQYSPFGGFCIVVLIIQSRTYKYFTDKLEKNFDKSLKVMKENYDTSLDFLSGQDRSLINKIKGKRKEREEE